MYVSVVMCMPFHISCTGVYKMCATSVRFPPPLKVKGLFLNPNTSHLLLPYFVVFFAICTLF